MEIDTLNFVTGLVNLLQCIISLLWLLFVKDFYKCIISLQRRMFIYMALTCFVRFAKNSIFEQICLGKRASEDYCVNAIIPLDLTFDLFCSLFNFMIFITITSFW